MSNKIKKSSNIIILPVKQAYEENFRDPPANPRML